MGYKIFVSYKHEDNNVAKLNGYGDTARAYVDYLVKEFKGNHTFKGEKDEDLSWLKEETIKDNHLKDKLHDSSITVVLISPGMKDSGEKERDQFIPWEVSYSLKEIERGGKLSHSNAVLAVVLPDRRDSYEYYLVKNSCPHCHYTYFKTDTLFKILDKNMFNIKEPRFSNCPYHPPDSVHTGEDEYSYIPSITWKDFLDDMDSQLDRVTDIQKDRKAYDITVEISNDW